MKFYGSDICSGCREAKALFAEKSIPYEFVDITANVANLRAFLGYRDNLPLFDDIRKEGRIGIPFFVEGECVTLDEEEAMRWTQVARPIETVAVIGTGALGMLFGGQMSRTAGKEKVFFVLDDDRYDRYQGKTFSVNGETLDLNFRRSSDMTPVDLVIVAVKYNSLPDALDTMKNCVGEDTTIISVMNGIDSEAIIGERYGHEKLVDTVAQGMDAMRDSSSLRYTQMGKLIVGVSQGQSPEKLSALVEFFQRTGTPYVKEENIRYRMWAKWMLNVGVNQTCMAYDTTYAGVLVDGSEENERFVGAMQEVVTLSKLEGVNLPESEIDVYINIIKTLAPNGYPSMAQDRKAGRKTEVEMFAGMVRRLAAKHGLAVPHNDALYERVKEFEATL